MLYIVYYNKMYTRIWVKSTQIFSYSHSLSYPLSKPLKQTQERLSRSLYLKTNSIDVFFNGQGLKNTNEHLRFNASNIISSC